MPKSAPSSPAPAASAAPQPSWPCATSSTAAYAPDHPTDMTRFALRAGKTLIPENPGEPLTLDACFDLGPDVQNTWPSRFEHLFKTKRNTIVHFKEPSRPLAPHPLGIRTSPEYAEYALEQANE